MTYIRRLLKRFFNWVIRDESAELQIAVSGGGYYGNNGNAIGSKAAYGHRQPNDIGDMNHGLHLTLYNAVGGKIIQFHSYDMANDRSKSKLYIVNDKEDLGVELGQILTIENLSR